MNQEQNNLGSNNFNTQGGGNTNNQGVSQSPNQVGVQGEMNGQTAHQNASTTQQAIYSQPQQGVINPMGNVNQGEAGIVNTANMQGVGVNQVQQVVANPVNVQAGVMNNNGMGQNQNVQSSTLGNMQPTNMGGQQNVVNNQVQTNNTSFDDEELLKAFIGKNYDKISTQSFNLAGLIFTSFYMIYRKMFLFGLLFFIISLVVFSAISNFLVAIGFSLLVGFLFNKLYLWYAKRKIAKIKIKNADKTADEIKEICKNKGGTSVGQLALGIVLEVVIVVIALVIITFMGLISLVFPFLSNVKTTTGNNSTNTQENGKFNGMLSYDTSINIAKDFSITVPANFKNESNKYSYNYVYKSGQGTFDECSVNLKVVNDYASAEKLIKQMASYYTKNNPKEATTTKINGLDWTYFSNNDAFGATYYYGTTKNNKVYLLQYEAQEDAAVDCDSYREGILNSVVSK